ncbi:MAG: trypsin-like peptidase domain-containing protein [Clostridia bacterium]|nr:trypsin-like peptidase domain-containing protein [Clostridia bacterium]
MENKKTYFSNKRLIIFALILFIIFPFIRGSFNLFGGSVSVTEEGDTATLNIVTLEETTREQMGWTDVANSVIPSIVAITSYNAAVGSMSSGSGIIISENGFIVTNAHVVDSDQNILTVIIADDTPQTAEDNPRYDAILVGIDNYTDLAVIKIEAEGLIAAEFADSNQILIAEGVMAVGFPGGLNISPSATVTIGYVSAVSRPIDMGNGYIINSIQTDAAINPGNSGGALVNTYGQVIGIPSSKIAATEYEGLGFAIPSSVTQVIVNDLIEYGFITNRATIGVGGVSYNEYYAQFYGVPVGILVQDIYADLTAQCGLQIGDRITKIEGQIVNSINVVNNFLQQKLPGDTLLIEVYRDGVYIDLTITLSDFNEVYGE